MDWQIDAGARAIGGRLKAARLREHFTRELVEERLGLAPRALEGYEQGTRTIPDDVLIRLGSLYRTHPAQLRYGDSVLEDASRAWVAAEADALLDLLRVAEAKTKTLRERVAPADDTPRGGEGSTDVKAARRQQLGDRAAEIRQEESATAAPRPQKKGPR